ncbi:DUF6247 family protein [Streptomyces sp. SID3343]|uniref:DUF6247 family protein n=1 Tax=Streptomyces sp. SID3343 TaxID=2690260 RepID=UPI0013688706|nr:DUF6247 family protein [Streptomyces sp. SID3343]MYV96706.1 hypothetical protein [Streptomyces sp. SID3343]
MTAPRDPREPDVTIHTGGALWPTPGQLRAELPAEVRQEFEDEYGRALDHARDAGDLARLADVLIPWQRRLVHHRNGDYEAVLERARRIREGDLSAVVPAQSERCSRADWFSRVEQ